MGPIMWCSCHCTTCAVILLCDAVGFDIQLEPPSVPPHSHPPLAPSPPSPLIRSSLIRPHLYRPASALACLSLTRQNYRRRCTCSKHWTLCARPRRRHRRSTCRGVWGEGALLSPVGIRETAEGRERTQGHNRRLGGGGGRGPLLIQRNTTPQGSIIDHLWHITRTKVQATETRTRTEHGWLGVYGNALPDPFGTHLRPFG